MRATEIIEAALSYGAELYIEGNQLKGRNTANLPESLRKVISSNIQAIVTEMESLPSPYLTEHGELRIPIDCERKYRWWQGGQSVRETLIELGAPEQVIEKYVQTPSDKRLAH